MGIPDLNDYEKEVVRFLAKRFDRGGKRVGETEFPRYEEVGQQEVYNVIARFENNFCWLDSETISSWTISPEILDVVHQLDHPPPKDYPKQVETWFRGMWWSVPFVYFPALVGYMILIKMLLQWVGILE